MLRYSGPLEFTFSNLDVSHAVFLPQVEVAFVYHVLSKKVVVILS